MKNTGIIMDNRYLEHKAAFHHPENPQRLEAIYKGIKENEIFEKLLLIEPRIADKEEIALIHDYQYIDEIESYAGSQKMLDADTYLSERSPEIARLAAGGLLNLVDAVISGRITNGFALIRPPGHHAEKDRAMGFCIYNNIAIGARYAMARYCLERIAIIDWDLHHGNGTQNAFYADPGVLYFSIHQYPHYPGTGAFSEIGTGKGEGFNINIPLSSGHGDADYCLIFDEIISPVCREFQPQLIMVSAGFDIYFMDPLGGMQVTEKGFGAITSKIISIADDLCAGNLICVLEGGYNLEGLAQGTIEVLNKMVTGEKKIEISERGISSDLPEIIKKVKQSHKGYWKCF
ncbi:MAG: histone deacetylase [Nitrospirae bacterium]|nr:histone deacetylase [Nitrospirota bacterium]